MGSLIKETPYSEVTATLELFDRCGLRTEDLTFLRKDEHFTLDVVNRILLRGWQEPEGHRQARRILGAHFFGVLEWARIFGIHLTKQQLKNVPDFPWDETTLKASCPFSDRLTILQTHLAFIGLAEVENERLTLPVWRRLQPQCIADHAWDELHYRATATCEFRWYLAFIETHGHVTPLPPEYEQPQLIEEVTARMLRKCRVGGISRWLPTLCVDGTIVTENRVLAPQGAPIQIGFSRKDFADEGIGLSAFRKLRS